MHWYYKLLARRPHLVLVAVGIFSIACIVVALSTRKLPDFDDPTLGFEARGTSIGKRWTAWRNLLEETGASGRLVANPKELSYGNSNINNLRHKTGPGNGAHVPKRRKPKSKKKVPHQTEEGQKKHSKLGKNIRILKELYDNRTVEAVATNGGEVISFEEYDNETVVPRGGGGRQEVWEYGRNQSFYTEEIGNKTMEKKRAKWDTLRKLRPPPEPIEIHIPSDGFFCESPNKEYAHLVVQRKNENYNDTLFELNAFLALCELEQKVVTVDHYAGICQRELTSDSCCRPWSIVNYVTFLSNKSSCFELNEEDVAMVKTLLFDCFQYYHNMKLSNDCMRSSCIAPSECKQHNAVYNILHYLANVDFIRQNESAEFLNATMIFLPVARSTKSMEFYHSLSQANLANELVAVVAMDMGLKNALFDECLLRDGWLIGLGGVFVVLCMWLYTGSLFVTLMTVVAVAFSLGIAYFIYSFIFELTFFPFMNLLAVIVVVGIGADDAFIFLKIWQCTIVDRMKCGGGIVIPIVPSTSAACHAESTGRGGNSDTLVEIMGSTLRHAALSMLVTSLTTAAAFYASYVSSITAVRCFGIFSGTAVMANYFLMVTWLPAAVSIAERMSCLMLLKPFARVSHRFSVPFIALAQFSRRLEDAIIGLVIGVPWLWISLLGTIGIFSGVLVLHWPKLRLPDSPDFKLFISNHPFERYDSEYKEMFWFEKMYTTTESFKIPLRFVWGVLPVDRGNFLDPEQRGDLFFDESFNMSAPESQRWLLQFCRRIKNQTFYQTSYGLLLPNCFIENFISWMARRCNDSMGEIDRTPCCEVSPFPFAPDIFDQCLPESISSLYETPREFFIPGVAGPKFDRSSIVVDYENGRDTEDAGKVVKAVVIEYESTQVFTMSYPEIDAFVRSVEGWLAEQLRDAPPTMANAWFISELEFFDLQDTLSTGTIVAIAMAMAVALLVLMLVTLNVLISLYAIVTVTFTILTTVAVLVLLGWKLNVLESVAVSTAIGLAVDFSLHYGVHYRLSTDGSDRRSSTRFSLQRMLGPTAMAAITTGIAGALMLPSSVLAYIQIGVFLVIVMSISWLYATFFLMSLLRLIGPQYGFGQFRYPKLRTAFRASADACKSSAQLDPDGTRQSAPHHHHHHHHHQKGAVSEQLLSNSSSAAGDLVGSESHELDSLTSNSIIKPVNLDIARPINFDRAFKKQQSLPREQSPSTASAITVVLPDDIDIRIAPIGGGGA